MNHLSVTGKTPNKESTTTDLDLLLTGDRHDNRVCVLFRGKSGMVPCELLDALVQLVVARIETESGNCQISRGTVLRLRHAIDIAAGAGVGKQMIEIGFKGEYHLTIPKSEMQRRVGLTACFFEFEKLTVISPAQATLLRGGCRPMFDFEDTQKRPSGDAEETKRRPKRDRTGTDKH